MIQALLSVGTVVFTMIPKVFIMMLACLYTNTIVVTMIQALLNEDIIFFHDDSYCLYSDSRILEASVDLVCLAGLATFEFPEVSGSPRKVSFPYSSL